MVVKIYRQGRRCLTNKNTPNRLKPRENSLGPVRFAISALIDNSAAGVPYAA